MITEKDTINEGGQSTKPPMMWKVATEMVLDALLFKPVDTLRRLALRSNPLEKVSHQPQEIK